MFHANEQFCLSHPTKPHVSDFPAGKFNTLLHDNECSFCLSQATHSQSLVSLIAVLAPACVAMNV